MAKSKQVQEVEETVDAGVDFSEGGDAEGVVVDLNNVEDAGFKPVPKGMYKCVVESIEFKISQSKGNPMWAWVFEVAEHENTDFVGRKFFYHTVFKGPGLPMTKRSLARVAPHLLTKSFNAADPNVYTPFIGMRVNVRVDIDNKNKEYGERNNVKDIYAATEGGEAFLNA
jgi:hypothetical protein